MTNSLSVLPFYYNLALQNHRKDYVYGQAYPLVSRANSAPPCQIYIPSSSVTIDSAKVKSLSDVTLEDSIDNAWSGVSIVNGADYSVIVIEPGNKLFSINSLELCYLELIVTYDAQEYTLYSEVFLPTTDITKLLKINYSNLTAFSAKGTILIYPENFYHELLLPTQVGKPDYVFEEDVTKRDGYTFIEKQVSEKKYKFSFLAPEYLLDAMRIIGMHNSITITNIDATEYEVDHFLITPKWDTVGDLATVEVEFECDTVVKALGTIG